MTTHYSTLEVSEEATPEEIKRAYRKLSMQFHPDRNKSPEATAQFQTISEAYEVLGDPHKKKEYDACLRFDGGGAQAFSSVDELFSALFGHRTDHRTDHRMMPGSGPAGNKSFPFFPSSSPPFSFPSSSPFSSASASSSPLSSTPWPAMWQHLLKPPAIHVELSVPFEKVLSGATLPIDVERIVWEGPAKTTQHETMYVTVYKGIDHGEIIVVPNAGHVSSDGHCGDVKVVVSVTNKSAFTRCGLDLIYEKDITLKESLCGFSFELKHLSGKAYTVTNGGGNVISPQFEKTIPQLGLTRDNNVGDLIVRFHVRFPEKLSLDVVETLKALNF